MARPVILSIVDSGRVLCEKEVVGRYFPPPASVDGGGGSLLNVKAAGGEASPGNVWRDVA